MAVSVERVASAEQRRAALAATAARRRHYLTALAYIFPAFVIYARFFLWPAGQLLWLSLHEWDGLSPRQFVGLQNYQSLLGDELFWLSFRHNVLWMLGAMVVPVIVGLLLAVLLSRTSLHGKVLFRTIYFLPQVLSSITVAIIWGWIYNPSYGALNQALEVMGLGFLQHGWLGDRNLALGALFIAWSWVHYGFTMVIFIAALENIDEVYFEAAKVDGASRWQQFRHVLLPFIRGPLTTVIVVTAIFSFQVFDLVFVLTNGGPGRASLVLPLYMLNNAFRFHEVGYGATIAVALGLFVLLFSVVLLQVRNTFQEEL